MGGATGISVGATGISVRGTTLSVGSTDAISVGGATGISVGATGISAVSLSAIGGARVGVLTGVSTGASAGVSVGVDRSEAGQQPIGVKPAVLVHVMARRSEKFPVHLLYVAVAKIQFMPGSQVILFP